jgi:hypothetical protein
MDVPIPSFHRQLVTGTTVFNRLNLWCLAMYIYMRNKEIRLKKAIISPNSIKQLVCLWWCPVFSVSEKPKFVFFCISLVLQSVKQLNYNAKKRNDVLLSKAATNAFVWNGLQKEGCRDTCTKYKYIYYFVYTSLHVFTQPDQGKAIVKLIKHLLSTVQK